MIRCFRDSKVEAEQNNSCFNFVLTLYIRLSSTVHPITNPICHLSRLQRRSLHNLFPPPLSPVNTSFGFRSPQGVNQWAGIETKPGSCGIKVMTPHGRRAACVAVVAAVMFVSTEGRGICNGEVDPMACSKPGLGSFCSNPNFDLFDLPHICPALYAPPPSAFLCPPSLLPSFWFPSFLF